MVSTDISPNHGYYNRLVQTSTNTTATVIPTSAGIPGFAMTSAADMPVRVPLENMGEKLMIVYLCDAFSSLAWYPQLDIRYANNTTDPGWAGRNYAVTSTVDLAFKGFVSTAIHGGVTASEMKAYCLVIDTAPFACNFGGTSSAITDKNESFIEIYAGQSSAAAGYVGGHNASNANVSTGPANFIGVFSVPR